MNVPFHRASLGEEEIKSVTNVIRSGWLTTGSVTREFEAEFSKLCEDGVAVALNSCTAALHLALEALGVQAGDKILVPTMTFAATAEVVRYFDAIPVFVDCEYDTLNLCLDSLEREYERERDSGVAPKGVIPVHYAGRMVQMSRLAAFAEKNELFIVEDAAHCCPAAYFCEKEKKWIRPGEKSDVACFSFYANKCITTGEGGMLVTQSTELAERVRLMSLHGLSKDAWGRYTEKAGPEYDIVDAGYKYNLTDIASALGVAQLKKADALQEGRERVARWYDEKLSGVSGISRPELNCETIVHSWHLYVIKIEDSESRIDTARVNEALQAAGIRTSLHWRPLHMHSYYRKIYRFDADRYPVAHELYRKIISLPIFPEMLEAEVQFVVENLKSALSRKDI